MPSTSFDIESLKLLLSKWLPTKESLYKFYIKNFLLIGLICAILISFSFPVPGCYLSKITVGTLHIRIFSFLASCLLFFFNGLTLKTSDIKSLYPKKYYFMYGLLCINFLTTLISLIMIQLPLVPHQFSIGLAIFTTVPSSLASGVAIAIASKADVPLAILLTVIPNLIGAFTVPALLKLYLTHISGISIDIESLLLQLVLCILIPVSVGMLLRASYSSVGVFAKRHRIGLRMFANICLLFIICLTLSASRDDLIAQSSLNIFYIFIIILIQYGMFLIVNFVLTVYVFGFPIESAVTLTIMTSQKSAPVALAVISSFTTDLKLLGLLAVPCIIGQIVQIFIGSLLAPYFARCVGRMKPPPPPPRLISLGIDHPTPDGKGNLTPDSSHTSGSDDTCGMCRHMVPSRDLMADESAWPVVGLSNEEGNL